MSTEPKAAVANHDGVGGWIADGNAMGTIAKGIRPLLKLGGSVFIAGNINRLVPEPVHAFNTAL